MPPGNHRNLAARCLYLGQPRRFLLRRPLPVTLDPRNNLAVHSTGLLLYLQKDQLLPRAALGYSRLAGSGRTLTLPPKTASTWSPPK